MNEQNWPLDKSRTLHCGDISTYSLSLFPISYLRNILKLTIHLSLQAFEREETEFAPSNSQSFLAISTTRFNNPAIHSKSTIKNYITTFQSIFPKSSHDINILFFQRLAFNSLAKKTKDPQSSLSSRKRRRRRRRRRRRGKKDHRSRWCPVSR